MKGGRVQRKNNWEPALSDHTQVEQPFPLVIRERPGEGHQHLLTKRDVRAFVELLPDWAELSRGLNAIILAEHEEEAAGWHDLGTVAVCAWDEHLWQLIEPEFCEEHRQIIERLGVPVDEIEFEGERILRAKWSESTARAFQLLHILLHELGHHHDRMTTRSRPGRPPRGEPYAEAYAHHYEALIWERYLERFGLDSQSRGQRS